MNDQQNERVNSIPVDDKMQQFIAAQFAQLERWVASAPTADSIKSVKTSMIMALRLNADSLVQSLPMLAQGRPPEDMKGYLKRLGEIALMCDAEIDSRIPVPN